MISQIQILSPDLKKKNSDPNNFNYPNLDFNRILVRNQIQILTTSMIQIWILKELKNLKIDFFPFFARIFYNVYKIRR